MNDETNQEKYLNITLKNDKSSENDEIIISFSGVIRQLKRFLVIWLCISIVLAVLVPLCYGLFATDQHKNLTALVSFNYDGIENGKAPDGSTFRVESIKNPAVIEMALTSMGHDLTQLEAIRQGISIEGVIPPNAQDKITMYKSIYEQGSLTAGEKMLEVKVYPTQFNVIFNYSQTEFDGLEAVNLFNTILNCYSEYFFETYGFNEALGSAVTTLDYTEYDYSQAIDVFESTLSTLQEYVRTLSAKDNKRFRSTKTGYTFSDLSESISTIREVDLDVISSYINVNVVTKDKTTLLAYYNYRIENLNRQKKISEDELKVVTEAIEKYEKDTIIIYGDNQDTSQYTQASQEYDNLINKKINAQKSVSTYTQKIDEIQKRVAELNGKATASKQKMEKVSADLESLSKKVNDLLKKVNETANEYYETVYLSNSYNILVPPSSSALLTTKSVVKAALMPLLILEAVCFLIYFITAFITALVYENRKKENAVPVYTANPLPVPESGTPAPETNAPKTDVPAETPAETQTDNDKL